MITDDFTNTILLLWPISVGIVLGLVFYGGLWFTVHRGLRTNRPALLFVSSFVMRVVLVLAGVYFVAADDWKKLLACLTGFIFARIIVTRLSKKLTLDKSGNKGDIKELHNAP